MTSKPISFSFFVLLLIAFIDMMSVGLVYPMFSSMMFHRELNFFPIDTPDVVRGFWLGTLLAAGPIAQFFSSPIIGTMSDQKGRKAILRLTLLIVIFGYFLSAVGVWVESLVFLLIGRLTVGIGTGNAAVVNAAIADLSSPEEKTKNFGLAGMAFGVGFTIGPFFGGKLSDWAGFDKPFLFAGLISLANLLLLIYGFKETLKVKKEGAFSLLSGIKNLRKAFHFPSVRILFLFFFIFCFGWSYYWEFIPITWMQGFGLTPVDVGNFYAYAAGFYALSCGLLIRPIADRFSSLSILFVALIILSISIFLLLMHTNVNFFWGYIPIQQFLLALLFPTAFAVVSNSVSEDMQGEAMGIMQSLEAFAFAVSPLVAGSFVGLNYSMPLIVGGGAMLLGSFVLFFGYGKKIFQK